MEERYNGWPNYETFIVVLNIDNDETLYHRARAVCGSTEHTWQAADALCDMVEDEVAASGFTLDLVHAALARVHWAEIVESMVGERREG